MFDLSINGDVARLTLRRPERRNAIPVAGWTRLASILDTISGKVLIVTGSDEAFCAGADISDFPGFIGDPDAVAQFRNEMRRALNSVRGLRIPTIAVVDGACYGAGVALAMACDMRIAAPGARFAITPAKLGISYPQEDVHRLVQLVGSGQASRLLFSADAVDAEEALRIGLVDLLVDVRPMEAAEEVASSIAANDPDSLGSLKTALLLAGSGIMQSEEQDGAFDAMFQSEGFLQRLKGHRSSKR